MKLFLNAIVKFLCGLLLVGLLVFLPAGSFAYFEGWLFCVLLFVPMFFAGIVMLIKAPALLEKRLDVKEKRSSQKGVVGFSGLIFIAGFVLAGLDERFGWSEVPTAVIIIASIFFVASYILYAEVMRENAYLSRTIKVEKDQKVVDTGLYSVVRHPMYAATVILFMMIPLILGSFVALIPFAFYPVLIAVRIIDEEKLLTKELSGYEEYKKKVKYRLIPFIW